MLLDILKKPQLESTIIQFTELGKFRIELHVEVFGRHQDTEEDVFLGAAICVLGREIPVNNGKEWVEIVCDLNDKPTLKRFARCEGGTTFH